jgi:cyanophycinase
MKQHPIILILFACASLNSFEAAAQPKGHLVIIGGGSRTEKIMARFVELCGGKNAKIAVFPMASSVPDESGPEQAQEIKDLGAGAAFSLKLTRRQAELDSALQLLNGVTGVFFTGGDQSRLTAALKGTKVETWLHQFYQRGGVLAGTSAGAAVMSQIMITGDLHRPVGDSTFNTIEAENVVTTNGFGFITDAVVDQHFVRRRRHNRLISVVLERPELVGIGIDESTAIWVKPDHTFEVLGESAVLVYDATKGKSQREATGYHLRGEGMRLHVLRHGAIYDLRKRKVKRL